MRTLDPRIGPTSFAYRCRILRCKEFQGDLRPGQSVAHFRQPNFKINTVGTPFFGNPSDASLHAGFDPLNAVLPHPVQANTPLSLSLELARQTPKN